VTVLAIKNLEVAYVLPSRACERSEPRSGADGKSGERVRSGERTFQKTLLSGSEAWSGRPRSGERVSQK